MYCCCSPIQPHPLLISHAYHKVTHGTLQLVNCSLIPVLTGVILIVIVSDPLCVCMCVCLYVCLYVCMCVCVRVCIILYCQYASLSSHSHPVATAAGDHVISFTGTANSSSCAEIVKNKLFYNFPRLTINSSYNLTTIFVSNCVVVDDILYMPIQCSMILYELP